MKLQTKEQSYESNTEKKSIKFGIGDNTGLIIKILRDKFYSRKIQTPVQEYMSNAKDATEEAGNGDKPIKVSLPTGISPQLKIRDFGKGISPDDMVSFCTYGDSTKRDSNDYIGGFGIGSKSAWAYTDSFQVITYIDGIRRSYLAHIGSSEEGELEKLSETKTDEANGTEIIIPVKKEDFYDFRKAVLKVSYFWKVKPTLLGILDDEIPTSYKELDKPVLEAKTDKMLLLNFDSCTELGNTFMRESKGVLLVIGGIPYGFFEKLSGIPTRRLIPILFFDNGELEISANRESVETTADNYVKIQKKLIDNFKAILTQESEVIKEASSIKSVVDSCNFVKKIKYSFDFSNSDREGIFPIVAGIHKVGKIEFKVDEYARDRGYTFCNGGFDWDDFYYFRESNFSQANNFSLLRFQDFLEAKFYIVDEKISIQKVKRKIRHSLSPCLRTPVVIWEKGEGSFPLKAESVNVIKTSTLETPPKGDKAKKSPLITIRRPWGEKKQSKIEISSADSYIFDVEGEVMYSLLENNYWVRSEFASFIKETYGKEFVIVSKSALKKIKNPNMISRSLLEDYTLEYDKKQIMKLYLSREFSENFVVNIADKFEDEELREFLASSFVHQLEYPRLHKFFKNADEIKKDTVEISEKWKKIKKRYDIILNNVNFLFYTVNSENKEKVGNAFATLANHLYRSEK